MDGSTPASGLESAPGDCPGKARWLEFWTGRLPESAEMRYASHLESCGPCRQLIGEFQADTGQDAIVRALRSFAFRDTSPVEPAFERVEYTLASLFTYRPKGSPSLPLPDHPEAHRPDSTLGRFRLCGVVGRGGFGVVYRAFDPLLRRNVAIKLPHRELLGLPGWRARFCWESQAAARLNHPNLVPVFESGEIDGTCFSVSEYCHGPTLARWLKEASRLPPVTEAAELAAKLADGVAHAHTRGVLHRDIKPGNVLLQPTEQGGVLGDSSDGGYLPRLTDFGLAKSIDAGQEFDAHARTRTGATVGTPEYMAPEQIGETREAIDVRTDVHALGTILYELLTGAAPFRGRTLTETLRKVESEEATPPKVLRREVPRDLQTVCLKALSKSPQERYATAQDLASDLRRFLGGQPVAARPLGWVERARRWSWRHPVRAVLAGTVVGAVFVAVLGLSLHNRRLGEALSRAESSEREARTLLYASRVSQAWEAWHRRDFARAREALASSRDVARGGASDRRDLRGFEWYYLDALTPSGKNRRAIAQHDGGATSVRFSPDGEVLASAGRDGVIRLSPLAENAAALALRGNRGDVNDLAFSHDGRRLASAGDDGAVRLWNSGDGRLLHVVGGHPGRIFEVTFSQNDRWVVSAGDGLGIRLWDVDTGDAAGILNGSEVTAMTETPGGSLLFTAHREGPIRQWDLETRAKVASFDPLHQGEIDDLAVSADGGRLLTASRDGTAREWDLANGSPHSLYTGHIDAVHDAAYVPGSQLLATASRDGTVRLWDLTGRQVSVLRGHRERVWSLDFSPDGRLLATAGRDGSVRIWNWRHWLEPGTPRTLAEPGATFRSAAAFSPGGERLAVVTTEGEVMLWDADGTNRHAELDVDQDDRRVTCLTFAGGGSRLVSGDTDGQIAVHDLSVHGSLRTLPAHQGRVWKLTMAPDDRLLASCGEDGVIRLWRWPSLERSAELRHHTADVLSIAFSPDGTTLASCGRDGEVVLWDRSRGTARTIVAARPGDVHDATFSPDGRLLATANRQGSAQVWNASDGTLVKTLPLPGEQVWCVDFSPDGRTLVTGGSKTIRFWQAESGQPLATFRSVVSGTCRVATFSPDGQTLVTAAGPTARSGSVMLWRCRKPTPDRQTE